MKWEEIETCSIREAVRLADQFANKAEQDTKKNREKIQGVWLAQGIENHRSFPYKLAWQKFKRRNHRRFMMKVMTIACGIACLITGGIWLAISKAPISPKTILVRTDTCRILPGSPKAVLTLGNGHQITLGMEKRQLEGEKGTSISADSSVLRYNTVLPVPHDTLVYHQLDVPRGGEYSAVLSDGTQIWLNADTRLKYPLNFPADQRKIYLTGEAFLDVSPDSLRPFIVVTDLGEITVYGTSFNIRKYADEKHLEATLVDGSISFVREGNAPARIKPGQQLVYRQDAFTPEIRKVDVRQYISWKENLLYFEDQSLEEIMQALARWYDINVYFEKEELKNMTFSGNLNRYADITAFFRIFETGAPVHIVVQDRKVFVRHKRY